MVVEEKEAETLEPTDKPLTETPEDNLGEEAGEEEGEGKGIPEGKEELKAEEKVEAKKPYTPEELEELFTSDEEIDTSRLTPEGRLLHKSFQRGYGKKFERLAGERKKLEEDTKGRESQKNQKEAYFERYLADPVGVVQEINAEIQRLTAEYDYEKAAALQNLKDEFQVRDREISRSHETYASFERDLVKEIPDAPEMQPKWREFALAELGFTDEGITKVTNPAIVGSANAIAAVKTVKKLYDTANAVKTAQTKVRKPTPSALERGGAGGETKEPSKGPDEPPQEMGAFKKWHDAREKKKLRERISGK